MSEEDQKLLKQILDEINAKWVPPETYAQLKIRGEMLQRSLSGQRDAAYDLRKLLGELHHDLMWLRKHVARLNEHLSKIIDTDPPTPPEGS